MRTHPVPALTWAVLFLAVAGLHAAADPVEQALGDVRDIRKEFYSTTSSTFGTLPGPKELAAAQVNFRRKYAARRSATMEIGSEKAAELAREYRYHTLIGRGRHGETKVPLGVTGAWLRDFVQREELVVAGIDEGSPADGVLQLNDIVVGVNGRLFEEGEDGRVALGYALAEARTRKLGGTLTIHAVRDGEIQNLPIKLAVGDDYSPTWPFRCRKSEKIANQAVRCILDNPPSNIMGLHHGGGYWTPLFLMASGDHEAVELVRRCVYGLVKDTYPEPNKGHSWNSGYSLVNLCEYYLLTGDSVVLSAIKYYKEVLENGQASSGSWGHGCPCGGYGEVNCVGLTCFIGLALARECGLEMQPVPLPRSIRFFGKFTGGGIPYGNHGSGPPGRSNNGSLGQAAVAFHVLEEHGVAERFGRPICYMYMAREAGHAERIFSLAWGPLGAAQAPPEEFHMFMNNLLWFYELGLTREGGIRFWPGTRFPYPGGQTGAMGLVLMLPRQQIRVAGAPRGVFGTRPPEPLKQAAQLYKEKKWTELKSGLDAYLSNAGNPHLDYAKALLAKYDWVEKQAEVTLSLVRKNIFQGKVDLAAKQLAALRRFLGEERPEMCCLRELLDSEEAKEVAKQRKKTAKEAVRTRWARKAGPETAILWDAVLPAMGEADEPYEYSQAPTSETPDLGSWFEPGAKPAGWQKQKGALAAEEGMQYWIRRTFTLEKAGYHSLRILTCNAGEVYLNGSKLAEFGSYGKRRGQDEKGLRPIELRAASAAALREGRNVLAARLWDADPVDIVLEAGPRTPDVTALRKGLIGYWQFDEAEGATVTAQAPPGVTATAERAIDWTPGKRGTALKLDGGKLVLAGVEDPADKEGRLMSMTLSVWAKSTRGAVLSRRPQRSRDGWRLEGLGGSATFHAQTAKGKQQRIEGSKGRGEGTPSGGFNHWVLTYDHTAAEVCLYCNGQLRKKQTLDGDRLQASAHPLTLSGWRGAAELDELAIWGRVLPQDEVLMLCSGGAGVDLK